MDIAAAESERQQRAERRADLDRRDSEHGGMISIDRLVAEQQRAETLRDWRSYRPSATAAEITAARAGEMPADPRRVPLARLFIDCGAAVRRFARAYRRDAAETLRDDALLLLIRWPHHGAERRIDLGGAGGCPLRRDWIERDSDGREQLTALAWRALHAAVKQAAAAPAMRAEREQQASETPADPLDISAAVEQQQRDSDSAARLPDISAPETLAALLDLPLDAARAIVARAYPTATVRDLAESWRMTESACKVALSRGAKRVRERYPLSADLMAALDSAAARYATATAADCALSLLQLRDGEISADDALLAARDWRALVGEMPAQRRALLIAALSAARRHRIPAERAERIAETIARLLPAEQRRGKLSATLAARGSHLGGAPISPADWRGAGERLRLAAPAPARQLTAAERRWQIGLERATERELSWSDARPIARVIRAGSAIGHSEQAQRASAPHSAPQQRQRAAVGIKRAASVQGCRACMLNRPHSDHSAAL